MKSYFLTFDIICIDTRLRRLHVMFFFKVDICVCFISEKASSVSADDTIQYPVAKISTRNVI